MVRTLNRLHGCSLTRSYDSVGTVISISQSTDVNFTAPIIARLRQKVSGLRLTADPSLLVQSLLDLSK